MKRTISRASSVLLAAAFAILGCVGTAAGQAQFKYTTIGVPGATGTSVYGINDLGQVVGEYTATGNSENGFVKAGQTVTTVNYPGAGATICYGINNAGEVVGEYLDTDGFNHAFLYENGTYTNIDPPGAELAVASGINNLGQIVGSYNDVGGSLHAFLLDNGSYETLDVPGAVYTQWAGGINDSGQVVLQWVRSDETLQSSVYDGSNYTQIQVPGAYNVFAYGVNNNGEIAITWQDSGLLSYGTVRVKRPHGYAYPSIEEPDGENYQTYCYGVNLTGVIAGSYRRNDVGIALGFSARHSNP